ncbi:hypothetical protein ACLOJK_030025 [Asimina triloba]
MGSDYDGFDPEEFKLQLAIKADLETKRAHRKQMGTIRALTPQYYSDDVMGWGPCPMASLLLRDEISSLLSVQLVSNFFRNKSRLVVPYMPC